MKNFHYIFWTKYYEHKYRAKNEENIIYMFHEIVDEKTNPKEFKTNKESFEIFLKNILDIKKAVSLEDIVKNKENGYFTITFDDVYKNFYTNAYHILRKYNIPFTLFISPGLMGKKGFLSKKELEILSKDKLCTIGAHTINHVRLRTEKNSYEEIKKSKEILEKILNKEVRYFAYPYGSIYACSNKNIKEVKKIGFEAAFSTIRGTVPKNIDKYKYFLPRVNGDHVVKEIEERRE